MHYIEAIECLEQLTRGFLGGKGSKAVAVGEVERDGSQITLSFHACVTGKLFVPPMDIRGNPFAVENEFLCM